MSARFAIPVIRSRQSGFTLVELIATVILIGILAVAIVPRFSGTFSYAEYTLRDQLISSLRLAQQRAMYDHNPQSCYRLFIDTGEFGPQRSFDHGVTFEYFGPNSVNGGLASQHKIVAPLTVTSAAVDFDGLGNALSSAAGPCSGVPANRQIVISNEVQLDLCVLSTGFVENFACP